MTTFSAISMQSGIVKIGKGSVGARTSTKVCNIQGPISRSTTKRTRQPTETNDSRSDQNACKADKIGACSTSKVVTPSLQSPEAPEDASCAYPSHCQRSVKIVILTWQEPIPRARCTFSNPDLPHIMTLTSQSLVLDPNT